MTETDNFGQAYNALAILFFYLAIVFPLIGGTILWMAFRFAKVPGFTFVKSWKVYLAGLSYSYLVVIGLVLVFRQPFPVFQTILFFIIPLVAIPLLARDFSQRALGVEVVVILVANSIMLGFLYMSASFLQKPSANNQSEMGVRSTLRERAQ